MRKAGSRAGGGQLRGVVGGAVTCPSCRLVTQLVDDSLTVFGGCFDKCTGPKAICVGGLTVFEALGLPELRDKHPVPLLWCPCAGDPA